MLKKAIKSNNNQTNNIQDKKFTIPPLIKHKTRQDQSLIYRERERAIGRLKAEMGVLCYAPIHKL
jgi:hypothetical protein